MNNDIVVHRSFLSQLVRAAEESPKAGIVAPFLYWYECPHRIQQGGEKMRWFRHESIKLWEIRKDEQVIECENVSGACLLIRRNVFDEIGMLACEYFVLHEDIDFCQRVLRGGYKIFSVRSSKVWHKMSISLNKNVSTRAFYSARNKLICAKKFLPWYKFFLFILWHLFIDAPRVIIGMVLRYRQVLPVFSYIQGLADGILYTCGKTDAYDCPKLYG